MGKTWKEKWSWILIAAGLIDSAYLLYINTLNTCSFNVCSLSPLPPSVPQYLPALLGLLWFALSVFIFSKKEVVPRILLEAWRVSGVAGVSFLGTYALLSHYYCPLCFTAYAIGLLLIWLSKEFNDHPFISKMREVMDMNVKKRFLRGQEKLRRIRNCGGVLACNLQRMVFLC